MIFSEVQVAPPACLRSKQRLRWNLHGLVPLPFLLCLQVRHHEDGHVMFCTGFIPICILTVELWWQWLWWWHALIKVLMDNYDSRCNKNPFLKQGWTETKVKQSETWGKLCTASNVSPFAMSIQKPRENFTRCETCSAHLGLSFMLLALLSNNSLLGRK